MVNFLSMSFCFTLTIYYFTILPLKLKDILATIVNDVETSLISLYSHNVFIDFCKMAWI